MHTLTTHVIRLAYVLLHAAVPMITDLIKKACLSGDLFLLQLKLLCHGPTIYKCVRKEGQAKRHQYYAHTDCDGDNTLKIQMIDAISQLLQESLCASAVAVVWILLVRQENHRQTEGYSKWSKSRTK